MKKVRKIFHLQRIHSVTVQPEFVDQNHPGRSVCEEMCVEDCTEAWCCEANLDDNELVSRNWNNKMNKIEGKK